MPAQAAILCATRHRAAARQRGARQDRQEEIFRRWAEAWGFGWTWEGPIATNTPGARSNLPNLRLQTEFRAWFRSNPRTAKDMMRWENGQIISNRPLIYPKARRCRSLPRSHQALLQQASSAIPRAMVIGNAMESRLIFNPAPLPLLFNNLSAHPFWRQVPHGLASFLRHKVNTPPRSRVDMRSGKRALGCDAALDGLMLPPSNDRPSEIAGLHS